MAYKSLQSLMSTCDIPPLSISPLYQTMEARCLTYSLPEQLTFLLLTELSTNQRQMRKKFVVRAATIASNLSATDTLLVRAKCCSPTHVFEDILIVFVCLSVFVS
ncbi:hypothetical protein ANCCAN_13379 [Ancylostoma caninum]|uniref:Uncharacterized protein n=1 Tax=Ancylostoma caninum TaxID=29170 RepID=A0A368G8F4_ANCCA|nr:hypothetical protein ANCCAN_13379 [Ancylostoma caninum]